MSYATYDPDLHDGEQPVGWHPLLPAAVVEHVAGHLAALGVSADDWMRWRHLRLSPVNLQIAATRNDDLDPALPTACVHWANAELADTDGPWTDAVRTVSAFLALGATLDARGAIREAAAVLLDVQGLVGAPGDAALTAAAVAARAVAATRGPDAAASISAAHDSASAVYAVSWARRLGPAWGLPDTLGGMSVITLAQEWARRLPRPLARRWAQSGYHPVDYTAATAAGLNLSTTNAVVQATRWPLDDIIDVLVADNRAVDKRGELSLPRVEVALAAVGLPSGRDLPATWVDVTRVAQAVAAAVIAAQSRQGSATISESSDMSAAAFSVRPTPF